MPANGRGLVPKLGLRFSKGAGSVLNLRLTEGRGLIEAQATDSATENIPPAGIPAGKGEKVR